MKSILLKHLSALTGFSEYFKYSNRLIYTAKMSLRKSMKDQIPYLTKVHKLRDKFRLVFTQAIPRNVSGWLAQRSEFRIRYLGKLQKTLLCFCVCVGLWVFWSLLWFVIFVVFFCHCLFVYLFGFLIVAFLLGWVKLVLWIEKFSIFYLTMCPGTDE